MQWLNDFLFYDNVKEQNATRYYIFFALSILLVKILIPPNGLKSFDDTVTNKDTYFPKWVAENSIILGCFLPVIGFIIFYYNVKTLGFDYSPFENDLGYQDYLGIAICIFGSTLRIMSFKILDRFFTYNVAILKEHKLVKSGPYKIIRHPSYTGLIFALFGLQLFIHNNLLGFVILQSTTLFLVLLRISNEEEVLSKHFKQEWAHYCKHTWAILPFIY